MVLWPSLFSDHRRRPDGRGISVRGGGRSASTVRASVAATRPRRCPAEAATPMRSASFDELQIETAFFAGVRGWPGRGPFQPPASTPGAGPAADEHPVDPNLGQRSALVPGTRWIGSTTIFGRGVARSMISTTTRRDHPGRVDEFVSAMSSFDPAASTTVRTVLTRSPGLVDLLPQVAVPTGVLLGAEDQLCPVQRLLPFARSIPESDGRHRCGLRPPGPDRGARHRGRDAEETGRPGTGVMKRPGREVPRRY